MTNPKEVLNEFDKKFAPGEYDLGYDEQEEEYKKIKQFIISSQIATLTSQLEAIPEDEEIYFISIDEDGAENGEKRGINQERQRQRQALQLAIKEWTELK